MYHPPARYPELADSAFRSAREDPASDAAAEGTLDTFGLWGLLAERSDYIEKERTKACGYLGPRSSLTLNAVAGTATTTLGRIPLPPRGNSTNTVRVLLLVQREAGTADFSVRQFADIVTPPGSGEVPVYGASPSDYHSTGATDSIINEPVVSLGSSSATGWLTATIDLHPTADSLVIYGAGTDGTAEHYVLTAVVLSEPATTVDGNATPSTWEKLSATTHTGTADRPDDVYTVRRLRRQQDHVVARYPRTLAAHSYQEPVASGSSKAHKYKVYRGPKYGECTLRVYATSGAAANLTVRCSEGTTTSTATPTEVTGSPISVSTEQWYSLTIPAATFATAEKYYDFWLECADGITLHDVVLEESVPSDADFLASGDTIATRAYPAAYISPAANDPIVASYASSTLYSSRKTDRRTLVENTTFQAGRRVATLLCDHLSRDATSGLNETSVAWSSAATIWRTKIETSYGCDAIDFTFLLTGVWETTGPTRRWRVQLYKDGSAVSGAVAVFQPEFFRGIGSTGKVPLRVTGLTAKTAYEFTLKAGYEVATGGDDGLALDGASFTEITDRGPP